MLVPDFEKADGLVPVIVQDTRTNEILMQAYMNEEAWERSVQTGVAHYWSRSRQTIWKKGESSGNVQQVKEIRLDCDADCILLKVVQIGDAACHTGFRSCFYRILRDGEWIIEGEQIFDPKERYGEKK